MQVTYNVLLLDDEVNFRRPFAKRLRRAGFSVRVATSVKNALSLSKEFDFDACVIDIRLTAGGMEGLEVVRSLRETGEHLYIEVMTAFEEFRSAALEVGADEVIIKPALGDSPERLRNAIGAKQRHFLENATPNELLTSYVRLLPEETALDLEVARFEESSTSRSNRLDRTIDFAPEHRQAGISILSYFASVLEQKYPNEKTSCSISQEGLRVSMRIEAADGTLLENVEQTLHDYGLVVVGKLRPDQLVGDPYHVMQLKNKIEIAHLELRMTNKLLLAERGRRESTERRLATIEVEVEKLHKVLESALGSSQVQILSLIKCFDSLIQANVGSVRDALILLKEKMKEGVDLQDDKEAVEAAVEIQEQNPSVFSTLKGFSGRAASGAAGRGLYELISEVMKLVS